MRVKLVRHNQEIIFDDENIFKNLFMNVYNIQYMTHIYSERGKDEWFLIDTLPALTGEK